MHQNFHLLQKESLRALKMVRLFFMPLNQKYSDIVGEQNMEEIFIYALDNESPVVVLASRCKKNILMQKMAAYIFDFKNGTRYEGLPGDKNINILNFEKYDLEIVSGDIKKSIVSFSKIEERSTIDLLREGGS